MEINETTEDELNLMTERDIQLYDDINLSLPEIDDAQTVVTLFEQQVEQRRIMSLCNLTECL